MHPVVVFVHSPVAAPPLTASSPFRAARPQEWTLFMAANRSDAGSILGGPVIRCVTEVSG